MRTDPKANSREVSAGDSITVYLSKGKEVKKTKVPNLYGMSEEDARRELENNNLDPGLRDLGGEHTDQGHRGLSEHS